MRDAVTMAFQQCAPAPASSAPELAPPVAPLTRWAAYLAIIAVALLAAALSLRGLSGAEPAFPDASRHVMNGALIHDMIRDGGYANPIEYARSYYTRAPALSLPYHPPVFPAMEAAAFAVFGVRYDVARIVVAFTVAVSVLLFGILVLRTHGSIAIAALSAAAFVLLPFSQWVAHEVMLEFPSAMFITAALFPLAAAASEGRFTNRTASTFAVLAIVAFWTKQHAIFLAAVPFAFVFVSRRWTFLRDWRLWAACLAIGASVALYSLLIRLVGAGSPTVWRYQPIHEVIAHHIWYYTRAVWRELTWAGALAVAFTIIYFAWQIVRRRLNKRDALYVAWAISYAGFLLAITPWDTRYLFYLAPPVAVLLFSAVRQSATHIGASRVWAVVCVLVIAAAAWTSQRKPDRLQGFYAAAQTVADMNANRILICSLRNGAFTTGTRTVQPHLQSIILRADAFPAGFFETSNLSAFLHEYGIDAVVVDDTPADEPWDVFRRAAIPSLKLLRTVPVTAENLPGGEILVFQHTNPSPQPKQSLRLGSTMIGGGIDIQLR